MIIADKSYVSRHLDHYLTKRRVQLLRPPYRNRIAQHLLTLTAAIWHNHATTQPITRSLTTYDH